MARRKSRRSPASRGSRGRPKGRAKRLGSVIRIRQKGVGQLNRPSSIVGSYAPALIGGLATAAITIALRMMTPKTEMQMRIMEFAPWIGGLSGTVIALLVGSMSGRPAGYGVAAGSTVVSVAMIASEAMAKTRLASAGTGGLFGRRRLGAIVMEPHASRGYGAGPLGAIVPEYANTRGLSGGRQLGAYGDTVNLGNVNQGAFGTPGFNVRGAR